MSAAANAMAVRAQVAQLVEHATENRSVGGSIPPLGTTILFNDLEAIFGPSYAPEKSAFFESRTHCGLIWPDLTLHQATAIKLACSCASAATSPVAPRGRAGDAAPRRRRSCAAAHASARARHQQHYGAGLAQLHLVVRQLKPRFTEALGSALAAYPEARVELGDKAIHLDPARPPIARIA
jgi:hypothetical protein